MSITKDQIILKGHAIIDALNTMNAKEREKMPSQSFAHDYNNFRDLALKQKPDLEQLFPPVVQTETTMGVMQVFGRYVEILAYSMQIVSFLKQA